MTKRGAWDGLDETMKRAPWQWRKVKGQELWRPKDGQPYTVRREEGAAGPRYVARLTGDNPEQLDAVFVGDDDEASARETAQTVCESHWRRQQDEAQAAKLGIATALDWREGDDGIWTAAGPDGRTYTCEEDLDAANNQRWFAALDEDELTGATGVETLEGAKRVCQWHRDTTLVWEPWGEGDDGGMRGMSSRTEEPYIVSDQQGGKWSAQQVGEASTWDEIRDMCQEHHRAAHPLGAAELLPAVEPAPIGKPEAIGKLPAPRRADWVIPVPLTEAEKAQAKEEFDEIWDEIRLHRRDILASAERHAALKKRKTEQIGELESQLDELRERMPERPVDCVRSYVRDGEEIWVQYTRSETHEDGHSMPVILHEHQLTQHEQRQLFGEGDPPADKPPEPAPQDLFDGPGGTEAAIMARQEKAAHEANRKASADEAVAELARQTGSEEFLAGPPPKPLKWGKISKELTWVTKGAVSQYRVDLATEPGVLIITLGAPDRLSEHQELHRWSLGAGMRVSVNVKKAKHWCEKHRYSRLRWPGDPTSGLLVSACNRYQCVRHADGDEVMVWHAEAIGGQDQNNTDLKQHDELQAAQAACQAHADERGTAS